MEVQQEIWQVPQELKDMPIPPDSDPRKRRVMKAATAAASSGSSQMEDSRAVAETPTQQKSTTDESRKDVEGEKTDESRRSTAPNTRRRIATKTSLEENESGKTTVAVTTKESLDGIREKAIRIASFDELETGSSAERWSTSRGAANDKTKKANELVRALVGQITKEVDIVVASDGKSKLWRDWSLKRAIQNWNIKYFDIARSPGSVLRVFTSSERLPNQLKFNEIGEVGKLVKKIHTNDPKVGEVWTSVIFGPEEPTKLEHDAMLASW